ncbi:membrane integrity-associated transporter subunit PqiC [Methylococcaceae bacterium WWC4]|nr:membrane integrity-associated transporter subunit PqiC [Methylococcaceae bacterium WWC4]
MNLLSKLVLTVFAGLALYGCAGEPIRFYLLTAESGAEAVAPLPAGSVVGLGPIRLPAYLDRPQLVVEVGPHEYQLEEHQRWAERLDDNITRELMQSLAHRLGVAQVLRFPWPQRQSVDYQVSADLLALHQTAAGVSRMAVQWQFKKAEQAWQGRRFECEEPAGGDAESIVAAQSRCLSRFAAEIALALAQAR